MNNKLETVATIEIHTGVHILRRKQTNIITNGDGEIYWTGASIFKACRWCLDNEHYSVTMWDELESIRVMLAEPTE